MNNDAFNARLMSLMDSYGYGREPRDVMFMQSAIEYHTGRPVISVHHLSASEARGLYRDMTVFYHGECDHLPPQPGDKPLLATGMFKARSFATERHKMEVYEKALAKVLQWAQPCSIDNHVHESPAKAKAVIYAIVAPILQNATPPVPMDFVYSDEHLEGPATEKES